MVWYKQGWDNIPKEGEGRMVSRFFLKPEEERIVIFIDNEPFCFWEHELYLNNQRVYYTCIKGLESRCPLCEKTSSRRYYAGAFTILDLTEWTDKTGKIHSISKKLLIAKQRFLYKLSKQVAKRNGKLSGCKFSLLRTDGNAPRTGDNIEFIERVDLTKFDAELIKPFEYVKLFEPRKVEFLDEVVKELENQIDNIDVNSDDVPY